MDKLMNENSFDWALIHLTRYCDNDLFPPLFEFELIANNWQQARTKSLGINLETYTARPSLARYAPDATGSFRIVYRLDPLDAMMYTAIVHEIQGAMKKAARDAGSRVAGSLTIEPAADGSFFGNWQDAWKSHTEKLEKLAGEYAGNNPESPGGHALVADLQDLFGYIQPHRFVYKLINATALPSGRARILGRALFALFPGAGKGIPMGMAASTVLTEMILEEVDARMLQCTPDYTRWGSGIYAFFHSKQKAQEAWRDLSSYLLTVHSMTLVPERTCIVPALEMHIDETTDAGLAEQRMNAVLGRSLYAEPQHGWRNDPLAPLQPGDAHQLIRKLPEYRSAETTYQVRFSRAVSANPPDLAAASSILRKSGIYGITTILPDLFEHFQKLTPAIRDAALYLKNVLNRENVHTYASNIQNAWVRTRHLGEYIRDWWCHILTSSCFNEIDLPADINEMVGIRNQALIALRKKDTEWVRRSAACLEALDLWDRRAVLYACSVLSLGERTTAARVIRRGISEQAVARYVLSSVGGTPSVIARPGGLESLIIADEGSTLSPPPTTTMPMPQPEPYPGPTTTMPMPQPNPYPESSGRAMATPDSHPGYGDKAVQPSPRWLIERVPELDALLNRHGSEIMVSFQDSVDSGNCMSGTEAYRRELLARLGLPPQTLEVQASALLADRDDPLVRRAARAAALRWASLHPGAAGTGI